ncbi:ABC transporter ATP-binding protein [Piscinibacterium candidicorallinum]|uniref:ABC transporter ATP-binding protein n=1 Tax=Piscinibacterium candidicorallinum TaxID=1793872 RepID=A0ABV7H9L3_9BURK
MSAQDHAIRATSSEAAPLVQDGPGPQGLGGLLAGFVRRHLRAYVIAALMLAGVAVLTVWLPRQIGYVVDALVARQLDLPGLARELGLMIAAGVAIYFLRVGWRLYLFAAAYQLGQSLRTRLYTRLTLQGPRFFQRRRTGDLMANATNDIDAVEMTAGEAMLAGFDGTLTLVLVVAMMTLGVDWRLALVALLPFPLMALAFWHISRHVHEAWAQSLDRFSKLNEHVQETFAGVRTVRALGLEQRSEKHFGELAKKAADTSFDAQRWEAAYEPAVGFTLATATAITLGFGGYLIWQKEMTVGQLTTFSLYLGNLIWPMFAAGWVLSLIERGKAAWARLGPVLHEPLTVEDAGSVTGIAPGPLVAQALSFTYPTQQRRALDDVDFRLEPGQMLGLVGPTGAGKTTLVRLLLRQYAPSHGALLWSGKPLADYSLQALREAVSWVSQEPFLFTASVADNIRLAKPDATREEVERVARLAAVHEDIMRLPRGYDTPVGERGVTLSGGQNQRVAIARALLADAPLLVLDDALSAVDTGTEAAILSHMKQARAGRTVIVIGHRLSALVEADHTLVLRDGRVVEQGNHAQLVAHDGWYARQWRYQQLEASLDAD